MIFVALAIGLLTGIISGCGIGGGSLLILYLTAVAGMDQHLAGGVNLLYFLCCAPTALISHVKNKQVEWKTALWCVAAGTVTTVAASFLSSAVSTELLRRLFGGVLLYVGVKELFCKGEKRNKKEEM